ncbi:MAG: sugar kinase [Spirochaetota bacterium]
MSGIVVTFGEVMGRLDTLEYGKLAQDLPGNLRFTFAGAEANVAASIAILGGAARFVTALPRHDLGDACVRRLRGLGMDTDFIVRSQGRLGTYYVETGANQRPSKVIYDREFSAVSLIEYTAFDWEAVFAGASWLHISGITPALSEQSARNSLEICKLAKQYRLTVSCDLNFRKKLWRWQDGTPARDLARRTMPEILRYVDVLIANEEDAADVLDIHAEGTEVESGQIAEQAYAWVAEQIMRRFPHISQVATTLRQSVSATHNNWGAMLYSGNRAYYAPLDGSGHYAPYEIRSIVDRVGGGDSFAAGLVYALNCGSYAPQDALRFAAAASCLCHSIRGDFNFSTREEVELLMNGSASGRVQR